MLAFPIEDFGADLRLLSETVREGKTDVLTAEGIALAKIVPMPEFDLESPARISARYSVA